MNWELDYKAWHNLHFSPAIHPRLIINTGSMLQRYLNDENWGIAPKSVIDGAMRSNPNLTFYRLKSPPPRICYAIKNYYPNINHLESINDFEKNLTNFISQDSNICSFENWMLNG